MIYMTCKYSLPVCNLSFHSLNSVFHTEQKFLILIKSNLACFISFYGLCFWGHHLKIHFQTQNHVDSLLVLYLTFRSMIYFEVFLYLLIKCSLYQCSFYCAWTSSLHLVQTQLTAFVWLYFWTLFCSVELCVYPANTILSLITWALR